MFSAFLRPVCDQSVTQSGGMAVGWRQGASSWRQLAKAWQWRAQVRREGRQLCKTFLLKADAEARAREIERDNDQEIDPSVPRQQEGSLGQPLLKIAAVSATRNGLTWRKDPRPRFREK